MPAAKSAGGDEISRDVKIPRKRKFRVAKTALGKSCTVKGPRTSTTTK